MNSSINQTLDRIRTSIEEAETSKLYQPFTKQDWDAFAGAEDDALMYHGPGAKDLDYAFIYVPSEEMVHAEGFGGATEDSTYVLHDVKSMQEALRETANAVRVIENNGGKWNAKELKQWRRSR